MTGQFHLSRCLCEQEVSLIQFLFLKETVPHFTHILLFYHTNLTKCC